MKVELRDGQWADIRERITHGDDKDIKRAYREDGIGAQTVMLRKFLTSWKMNDPDGRPITLEDPDAIDRMPEDIADELYEQAGQHYGRATRPNPPTPPSSDEVPSAAT